MFHLPIFEDDLKHGLYHAYYENGKLSVKGYFKNGVRTGTWTYGNRDGTFNRTEKLSSD